MHSGDELPGLTEVTIVLRQSSVEGTDAEELYPVLADAHMSAIQADLNRLAARYAGSVSSVSSEVGKLTINLSFADDLSALEFTTTFASML